MRTIYDIAKAELQMLFYSPIAWLIIIIFTIQTGMRFAGTFDQMVWTKAMDLSLGSGLTEALFPSIFTGVFPTILGKLYLYMPLLTMGLVSRELSSGSIKLLYSSPVTNTQIILGKFFSMMLFGLLLVGIIGIYVVFSAINVTNFDLVPVLIGLLGVYLLICTYAAIGIYMSSLTSYQVVAAISTLFVLGVLNFVKGLWQHIDWVRDITWWLGIFGRTQEFVKGMLCSEDIIYFILVPALFLTFAIIRLQGKRKKTSPMVTWGKYIGTFLIVAVIGYATSRPNTMVFYDTTATKHNTLTKSSQDIVSQLDGGLKITTYVNVLDPDFGYIFPRDKNRDMGRFEQYTRFKPEIEFEYVYYYDTYNGTDPQADDAGEGGRAKMIETVQMYREDSTRILRPQEIREIVDLWPENNHVVRVLERESGGKTFLRTFNDQMKFPSEAEISIAMKHLLTRMPLVGFTEGHGERNYQVITERDYSVFTDNKPYRNALINQGYDFTNVDLNNPIPQEMDILVISDMRQALSEEESAHLDDYIARGGNLLIIGDLNRQEQMNPLVGKFGVEFMPGQLVSASKYTMPDLILAKVTPQGEKISDLFAGLYHTGSQITLPGCLGLAYSPESDYQITPLFETTHPETWNEVETTDFIDGILTLNPEKGEKQQAYPTMLALQKQMNGKEQKIIIMGDADCFSNGEMTKSRKDVPAYNFSAIISVFNWLGDNKAPLYTSRPEKTDNDVTISEGAMKVAKPIFDWIFPGVILLLGVLVWVRRKSR